MRLQGSAVNSTTIQLQWQPPLFSDQNGVIRSYLININVVQTGAALQLTSQTTAINISGLHPHYTYTLTVAAVTIGPGPYGLMLTIRMPEDGMDLSSRFFLCINIIAILVHTLHYSSKQCTSTPPRQCS